ncbi:MAG: hypothetical protein HPY66_0831 [Firmicutes bacterium]|nr:hypothetical protein [Bacillota bacterium]MDI6705536.1 YncE family protein [Bacillota bacterium]
MGKKDLILTANMGDDSICIYNGKSFEMLERLVVKPSGFKLFNTSHFTKGPAAGPGHLYHYKSKNIVLALNVYDDSLLFIDLDTFKPMDTIFAGNHPYQIEVFEEADRAFVSNYDSDSISVIDLSIPQIVGQIPCGMMPQSLVINRNTSCLYVTNTGSDYISIIDVLTLDKLFCLKVDGNPVDICNDAEGERIFVIVRHPERQVKDQLVEYDMVTGKRLRSMELGLMPVDILYNNMNESVYALDAIENNLRIINVESFDFETTIHLGRMPINQCLNSERSLLFVVCMIENKLYVVDTHRHQIIREIPTGIEPSSVLFVS